jgi:hypothetical protein
MHLLFECCAVSLVLWFKACFHQCISCASAVLWVCKLSPEIPAACLQLRSLAEWPEHVFASLLFFSLSFILKNSLDCNAEEAWRNFFLCCKFLNGLCCSCWIPLTYPLPPWILTDSQMANAARLWRALLQQLGVRSLSAIPLQFATPLSWFSK